MDIGGSFGVTEGLDGMSGVLFSPSVGARIGSKKAVTVGLGYVMQKWSETYGSINMDAFKITVGFSF